MKRCFRDLIVWQRAIALVVQVYRKTADYPVAEKYGLQSQMRRSAVSIPSNIAEGQGRLTRGEFRQFLGIAKGSLAELETELIVSVKLNLLPRETTLFVKVEEVSKLLNGLLASI
jgi:four helix bundle protein